MYRQIALRVGCAFALLAGAASMAEADPPFRKIGEMELSLLGITADLEPAAPVVPRNIPSGVRVVVRAGGNVLTVEEVKRFLGLEPHETFQVRAELSGPSLGQTVTLPLPGVPVPDPLLLPFPGLAAAGDHHLTGARILVNGQPTLDVRPDDLTIRVIDQILVTSVKTRPLTLDEIRARGIVLDADDYLGFEFTLGLRLESEPITINFPAVFDRKGIPLPLPLTPPPAPPRSVIAQAPLFVPMLLERTSGPGDDDPSDDPPLTLPNGGPLRIPALLVIPGEVGYLKQFFSAQLFVANGAPVGAGLVVHDVTGTLKLPPGPDGQVGTEDDPIGLPELPGGTQPLTMPVKGVGPDGQSGTADDVNELGPGEQGMADFTVRGEFEGFHPIGFDIDAVLEGLPTGPVHVTGQARGGVLVRNPYIDMTFTLPSVVREDEEFDLYVTLTNIGGGAALDLTMQFEQDALSFVELIDDDFEPIEELQPRESRTFRYRFLSLKTGQVVASYLRFDTEGGGNPTGRLDFRLGIGERGVALSPDTLVLPNSVEELPPDVVRAAMRVLGQAWSVAKSPTLPAGVLPIDPQVVRDRALSLAEAGLRRRFGQGELATVRDYTFDLHAGMARDDGFDQLMRQTNAGQQLDAALGARLRDGIVSTSPSFLEEELAEVGASGADFISFAVGRSAGLPAVVTLRDSAGRVVSTAAGGARDVPGAALLRLGTGADAPVLGLVGEPLDTSYTIEIAGLGDGFLDLSVTLPNGEGTFKHGTVSTQLAAGSRSRLVLDVANPTQLVLETDLNGDGTYEEQDTLAAQALAVRGPSLVAASVFGPEVLTGAAPFGYMTALLFDRAVDAESAGDVANYAVPDNRVEFAKRFLSGRIVLALLDQPEGPYVPTTVRAERLADMRGNVGSEETVDLSSLLRDDGAIVTGRIMEATGTPLPGHDVVYENVVCDPAVGIAVSRGISVPRTDANGFYQVRYVRKDPCGAPFKMNARDPSSDALRTVTGWVRAPGEHINLDIVFLGYGNVTGTVRRLDGQPAPGASVRVVSVTDPQVGALTTTDTLGRYSVGGITVGQVTVDAASGILLGHGSGLIPTAGGTAVVDVNLDGTANVSGTVFRVQGSQPPAVVAGAQVVFSAISGPSGTPVGVTITDTQGRYAFEGMPAGQFSIRASTSPDEYGLAGGTLVPGQTLPGHNITIVVPDLEELGTISGIVRSAGGSPVAGAFVNVGSLGAITSAAGAYQIAGVPVRPFEFQTVFARSADGLRYGNTRFQVNTPGQVVPGVDITLSGLGSVIFTVLDPLGAPVANQEVRLRAICLNPCGCEPKVTDAQGKVRWDGRAMGVVAAQAVRTFSGYIDVAAGQATLTQDGQVATATLRFAGAGSVGGLVYEPDGVTLSHGADVVIIGRKYFNDGEQVCGMLPDQVVATTRTDTQGTFQVGSVPVGTVKVMASHFAFPKLVGTQANLTPHGAHVNVSLQLTDTQAGEFSGQVYLPDGVTPAGANVTVTLNGPLPEVQVRTNAAGRYEFPDILPAGHYTAVVKDPATGGLAEAKLYLPPTIPVQHDFRLKSRGPVVVTVVTASNQPVASATVKLTELEYPRRQFVSTISPGNGGQTTFPGIYEGPIVAEASDTFAQGGRTSATRPPGTEPFEVKVTLSPTGTVRGHFVMPNGVTPIPFGTVRLVAAGQVIGQVTTAGAGDVGSFQFDYVPVGSVRVDAQDPLTARTGVATGELELEETLDLTIRAQGLGRVVGQVTDNGAPAEGASVEVRSGPYLAATSTDGSGNYVIEGVPEGQVTASASYANGFLRGQKTGVLSGDGQTLTLDVALQDSGTITGQLLKHGGEEPAPLSTVSVSAGAYNRTAVSNLDGTFGFTPVPAVLANLSAAVIGGIDRARGTADVPAAGTVDVTLTLNGIGALTGETRSSSGPIAGRLVLNGTGPFPYQKVIYTQADGQFALPELLAGPFTAQLQATVGGFTLYGSATGAVVADESTNVVVELQPTGSVVGLVLRADGAPAQGAEVTVQAQNGAWARVSAAADGTFSAAGVPVGTASVRVTDPITGGVGRVDGVPVTEGGTANAGTIVLDDTAIAVLSVQPPDGATGLPLNQVAQVTFSDPLASASGVTLRKGPSTLPASVTLSPDRLTVTLTPSGSLPDASEILVHASTAVTDIFGRHLAQAFTSRFHTVDLSGPVVATVAPANNAIQVPANTAVVVTFNEPLAASTPFATLIALSGPGGPVAGTSASTTATSATFTPAAPLAQDATYTVTVVGAVDASGNVQATPFVSTFKTIDTIPPVLTLTAPANGAWVRNLRPTVSVGVNDGQGSGGDATTASMRIDGAPVTVSASGTGMTHQPPADLAQGQHEVAASMSDRGGNVGTLPAASFGVDTVVPDPAQVTGVSQGQVFSNTTITIGGTAVDPGGATASGIARIELLRDGQATPFLTLNTPPFSTTIPSTSLPEGPRSITARAVDVAGNLGPQGSALTIVVDNVVVTPTITSPLPNTRFRDSVPVTATVSEPVERVDFSVGTVTASDTTAPYEATLDLTALPEGPATITVTAFTAGGGSGTRTVVIVVDRTAPAAPDASRISAEQIDGGFAMVAGVSGAVEGSARVEVTNTQTSAQLTVNAAGNGSFAANILALLDVDLSLVAIDQAGNRSPATIVTVVEAENQDGVPLEGLRLWVDADLADMVLTDGRVERWKDQTTNHNDLVPPDSARRPLHVPSGFNGLPVVYFDGTDSLNFTSGVTVRTVFWVLRESDVATFATRSVMGHGFNANTWQGGPGAPGTIWSGNASNNVLLGQTWLNGDVVDGRATNRPRTMSILSLVLAGPETATKFGESLNSSPWWGDLAELLVYDRVLSAGQRQQVEDYLVRKYRPYTPKASTPAISPAGGTFTGSTTVQLSSNTPGAAIHYTLDGLEPTTSSDLYEGAFVLEETTTVKARAFRVGYDDSETATATFIRAETSPVVAATGLRLWLRADAGIATNAGAWVSHWGDQSGNGNHATQANGLATPRLVRDEQNGLPVLHFDGGDMVRFTAGITLRTVFWVVRESTEATNAVRSLLGHDFNINTWQGGQGAPGEIWSTNASANVRLGQLYIDGVPVDGVSTPRPRTMSVLSLVTAAAETGTKFGESLNSSNWWGDLAELIIYDRPLTALERSAIEDYLGAKYRIADTVTPPRITPPGGLFADTVTVEIASQTPGASIYYTLDGSEPALGVGEPYVGPLVLDETTTVKARAFKDGLVESITVTASFTKTSDPAHPGTFPGMKLWWRADAGVPSGTGEFWFDQSGNGNHGFQTSGAAVPRLVSNAQNGLPVMHFDGGDTVRFTAGITLRTVFWVVRESTEATNAVRSLLGHDFNINTWQGGQGAPGEIWSANASANVRLGQLYLNGVPVDGVNTPRPRTMSVLSLVTAAAETGTKFGESLNSSNWWGDLAELIIYDRPLTALERSTVEDYLAAKYRIADTVTPPRISPPGGLFTDTVTVTIATQTPGASIYYTLDRTEPTPATGQLYTDALVLSQTTTVKAKAFKSGLADSVTVTATVMKSNHPNNPTTLPGLRLWWRADAGVPSGTGEHWADQSANANHGLQTSGAAVPRLVGNALGGLPVMHFDGGDTVRFTAAATVQTLFWVVRESPEATTASRSLLGHDFNVNTWLGGLGAPGTIWSANASANVRAGQLRLNGGPNSVTGTTTPRPTTMTIVSLAMQAPETGTRFGSSLNSSGWWGDLAELIVFDQQLTLAQVRQVEAYLGARYGITVLP